jgi:hypothetical protein
MCDSIRQMSVWNQSYAHEQKYEVNERALNRLKKAQPAGLLSVMSDIEAKLTLW